jgi:hypothetical protein
VNPASDLINVSRLLVRGIDVLHIKLPHALSPKNKDSIVKHKSTISLIKVHVENIIVDLASLVSSGWGEGGWRDARTGKKKNYATFSVLTMD